jgi:hypothetical protein
MSESHILANKPVSSWFRSTPLANPLIEIRLAILEPTLSDDDEIRCQLHTVNIAEAKYESLYYTHGAMNQSKCQSYFVGSLSW